ncbi:MAG: hypothetical protein REI94_06835, partial [Moraxellaceae bacterium]|nr:hypothetical protein [Moraxellaceae bacterium]
LSHLAWEGAENGFLSWCAPAQRQAVAALLCHMAHTRAATLARHGCEGALADAVRVWCETSEQA